MVLDAFLVNTQHYKVQVKGKWSNTGKGVALYFTLRCSSYWKGSLGVTLDYGRPTYYLHHPRHPIINPYLEGDKMDSYFFQ